MSGDLSGLYAALAGVLVGHVVGDACHAPGSRAAEVVCAWGDIAVVVLPVPVAVAHILTMSRWPPRVVSVAAVCRWYGGIGRRCAVACPVMVVRGLTP